MTINDNISRVFCGLKKVIFPQCASEKCGVPALVKNRDAGNHGVVIFVHGFHGNADETWTSFVTQFLNDNRLKDWDVYSVGYSTRLSVDLPFWTSDPEIRLCAAGLITKLNYPPLERYKAVTLVAHSMGGLIVQRAILDSDEMRRRLIHVVLYGTPSAGVSKATFGARFKPQARDMQIGSAFITQLREEWQEKISECQTFSFTAVAGETDAFIPPSSSIDPFPRSQQAVVPGNHLEIVRPDSIDHLSYVLLYKTLTRSRGAFSAAESARLAVEQKDFDSAIELLMPGINGLDDNAIVSLALALESVGRKDDAVEVIEKWNLINTKFALDPIGVLAGRLKRRWLVSRQRQDLERSLELYSSGLHHAEASMDHDQAYYHAINVAYLLLMSTPGDGPVSVEVKEMASKALSHVAVSNESRWTHATTGEARLMLGDLRAGVAAYQNARDIAKNLRECESMHMQAVAIAARVFGEKGTNQIDEVFGLNQGG